MPKNNSRAFVAGMLARFVMGFTVLTVFLFVPAGTVRWLEGWLLIVIFMSWSAGLMLYLKRHDPALLAKRLSGKLPSRGWDRIIVVASTVINVPYIILFGLDAVRYRWSEVPWFVEGLGFIGIIASLCVIFRVMKENTFLSRSVEIQAGHKVITTGPYRWVRHPMYSAYIAMMLCFSLALGSWYSLIPGALNASLLVIRAALEDKTLHAELPGYSEYAQTTRYRLLPGVW